MNYEYIPNTYETMNDFVDGHITDKGDWNNVQYQNNNSVNSSLSKKRKLEQQMDIPGDLLVRGRSFLPVRSGNDIFMTEEWKSSGTSLFIPLKDDLYINVHRYDQITAAQGSFFTADGSGNFNCSLVGNVIHLWRYDKQHRKQYIAQSLLFTNYQEFLRVQAFLGDV